MAVAKHGIGELDVSSLGLDIDLVRRQEVEAGNERRRGVEETGECVGWRRLRKLGSKERVQERVSRVVVSVTARSVAHTQSVELSKHIVLPSGSADAGRLSRLLARLLRHPTADRVSVVRRLRASEHLDERLGLVILG